MIYMNIEQFKRQIRLKFKKTHLPFVTLKFAQTLDGKIATKTGDSRWISSLSSRRLAHRLRSIHQAVLVGVDTIIKDDPQLTARLVKGRNPLRIVVDSRLRSPLKAKVFNTQKDTKTILATTSRANNKKIKQLEKLATEDDLTGMKNRRYIWEFSRQIIEHARKEGGRVTLLLFDIDNLKSYNDAYGHLAGDKILKQAAILMRCCCRSHDVVGRVGGDEFAVVFWDDPKYKVAETEAERRSAMADHPKEAIFIAKRFRRELNKAELHLLGPRGKGELTISGGLASFPRDGSTVQQLFSRRTRHC